MLQHHSQTRSRPPRMPIPNPTIAEQPVQSPNDSEYGSTSDTDDLSNSEESSQVAHQESTYSSSHNGDTAQVSRTSTSDALAVHDLPSASNIPGLRKEFGRLRIKQKAFVPSNTQINRRLPRQADFPASLSLEILQPVTDDQIEKVVILLHTNGGSERSLENFSRKIQLHYPESAFLLIRGQEAMHIGDSGYHWADPGGPSDGTFFTACRVLLLDVVKRGLIAKCGFSARDIIVLGHGQGGMAALAATAAWETVEFAGVVSIGGPMPDCAQLSSGTKSKTPALALSRIEGDISPVALRRLQKTFCRVTHNLQPTSQDRIPESSEEMTLLLEPLLCFFAHRLRREEWKKQAILSLGELPKILYSNNIS